ncbi:hypothetical protein ACG2K1_05325 [Neisseria sp. 23W00296]|uniref:hypothetical protein n=1 Tax=unclassified Neisseria TaxID=2623750 RepID=UPI0037573652
MGCSDGLKADAFFIARKTEVFKTKHIRHNGKGRLKARKCPSLPNNSISPTAKLPCVPDSTARALFSNSASGKPNPRRPPKPSTPPRFMPCSRTPCKSGTMRRQRVPVRLCANVLPLPKTKAREKIRRAVGQNPFPPLTFHPETARSVPLDIRFLQSTDSLRPHRDYAQTVRPHSRAAAQSEFDPQNWFVRLYRDFNEPPYGLGDLSDTGRRALWTDFCTQTGLLPDRGVSVRDWVRHNGFDSKGRAQSARHPLSSYFDDSLEWWGIWCLTVHNPRRGKVAAVAASVTD